MVNRETELCLGGEETVDVGQLVAVEPEAGQLGQRHQRVLSTQIQCFKTDR